MSEQLINPESESKVRIDFEGLYKMSSELVSDQSDKIKELESQLTTLREALEVADEAIDGAYKMGKEKGITMAINYLRGTMAAHSVIEKGKVVYCGPNHVGPTLMSANLWADYLEIELLEKDQSK